METERYEHHGVTVWVYSDLRGKHRRHCLCFDCQSFYPDVPDMNCKIAEALFRFDRLNGLVTPVYECPEFIKSEFPEYHNWLKNR